MCCCKKRKFRQDAVNIARSKKVLLIEQQSVGKRGAIDIVDKGVVEYGCLPH